MRSIYARHQAQQNRTKNSPWHFIFKEIITWEFILTIGISKKKLIKTYEFDFTKSTSTDNFDLLEILNIDTILFNILGWFFDYKVNTQGKYSKYHMHKMSYAQILVVFKNNHTLWKLPTAPLIKKACEKGGKLIIPEIWDGERIQIFGQNIDPWVIPTINMPNINKNLHLFRKFS